jgi:hypothetical protein
MTDYTITTNFGAKDSLPSGNAGKVIKGEEFTTEFTNIQTAVNTKADTAGDTFTGAVNFSADVAVNTNTLFVDVSENKVGIGTTSPANTLTVGALEASGIVQDATVGIKCNANHRGIILQENSGAEQWEIGVGEAGGLKFYDSGSATPAVTFADISGNVGIGTDSPDNTLHVVAGAEGEVAQFTGSIENRGLSISIETATDASALTRFNAQSGGSAGQIAFATDSNERMRIDASGNVGIGTTTISNPVNYSKVLNIAGTAPALVLSEDSGRDYTIGVNGNKLFIFDENDTVMTIDDSGNVLVGTTNVDPAGADVTGTAIGSTGYISMSRSNGAAGIFNRKTNNGNILEFNKDGSTVGSISAGASSGGTNPIAIGFGTSGLWFIPAAQAIAPFNMTTNAGSDNSVDLGYSSLRFDDIYATNGTIQTSDRNEKQGIRELLDAEQRVATACKGLLRAFKWNSSVEEKGDEARIHFGIIAQDLQDAFTVEGLDAGDYAMFINSTWTDEETGEERSRMGVRYSELLAFIISAI